MLFHILAYTTLDASETKSYLYHDRINVLVIPHALPTKGRKVGILEN